MCTSPLSWSFGHWPSSPVESFWVKVSEQPSLLLPLNHVMTFISFLIYFSLEDPAVPYRWSWTYRNISGVISEILIELPIRQDTGKSRGVGECRTWIYDFKEMIQHPQHNSPQPFLEQPACGRIVDEQQQRTLGVLGSHWTVSVVVETLASRLRPPWVELWLWHLLTMWPMVIQPSCSSVFLSVKWGFQ